MSITQNINDTIRKINDIRENTFNGKSVYGANLLSDAIKENNLESKRFNNGKLTKFYFNDQEVSYMRGMRPGSTSSDAFHLCKDKFLLEKHLRKFNLNTLDSEIFTEDESDGARKYVRDNDNTKFVIKPLNLAAGKGIQFNVTEENFDESWTKCIAAQKANKSDSLKCIVQPYIKGFDIRVVIIEGKFSGALLRLPAHVIGDGHNTIKDLIDEKNKKRDLITYFSNKLIPTNQLTESFLNEDNLSLSSVPRNNQVIMLAHISNLTSGGESIDVTDILSEKIKQLAINSVACIPGLHTAGIDIMTEDYLDGEGYVIEVNTNANLTMHHMPYRGELRYPYNDFVKASLLKHKVENNYPLTPDEINYYGDIEKFLTLKSQYNELGENNRDVLISLDNQSDVSNNKLIEDVLNLVKDKNRNTYKLNVSLNLFDVLKNELKSVGIRYEPFLYNGKERMKIFDGDLEVKTYQKNFYHNNSKLGFKISNDKFLTEKYLKLADIPTSNSILLREGELDKARNHIIGSSDRFVVKPTGLSNGVGVYTNVNLYNLEKVWEECFALQKQRGVKSPRVIVQDYIKGIEIRVIVTEGKAMSATVRVPANVVGNGQDSIEKLINTKNERRKKSGYFGRRLIKVDNQLINYLESQGLGLNSIPEEEHLVILRPVSNMMQGGENIVITDYIKNEILELAEAGVAAIPGIQTAGVDILLSDLDDKEAVILEINKAPGFQLNYYPFIGEPQHPLQYIFRSLILEDRILKDRINIEELSRGDLQLMSERYKALYQKQNSLEKIIKKLSE